LKIKLGKKRWLPGSAPGDDGACSELHGGVEADASDACTEGDFRLPVDAHRLRRRRRAEDLQA